MARNSIGLIELSSIAAGFLVCDAMLKSADVELVLSRTICSGKYMVMIRGDVVSQSRTAESPQVNADHLARSGANSACHARRSLKFYLMSLAVIE